MWKRKANARFELYFKPDGILCNHVGEVRLDDAVPDAWYDAWKAISGPITFHRDYPGLYEEEVEEHTVHYMRHVCSLLLIDLGIKIAGMIMGMLLWPPLVSFGSLAAAAFTAVKRRGIPEAVRK